MYLGVDIGGTKIKIGAVKDDGSVFSKTAIEVDGTASASDIIAEIGKGICEFLKGSGIDKAEIESIGIGVPGAVSNEDGVIINTTNINLKGAPIVTELKKYIDKEIHLANDADAASFGEYIVRNEKMKSFVLITLGTGVGAGIIIDGKIYTGFNNIAGEFGHTVMVKDGKPCPCGRKGCVERYASTTALIEMTKEAAIKNPDSLIAKAERISGRTAFEAMDKGDKIAKEVIDEWLSNVACAVTNIVNLLQPDEIMIGGGISAEGERILKPIVEYVGKERYPAKVKQTKISIASLGNDAGLVGAALLGR